MIAHNLKSSFNGKSKEINGDVYHIFGFDILLDEELKAWILEINEYPSFNIFFETDENSKDKDSSEEQILSQVDLHVKKNVMNDALKVAVTKNRSPENDNSHKNMKRILPCKDKDHSRVYLQISKIRQLFSVLSQDQSRLSSA